MSPRVIQPGERFDINNRTPRRRVVGGIEHGEGTYALADAEQALDGGSPDPDPEPSPDPDPDPGPATLHLSASPGLYAISGASAALTFDDDPSTRELIAETGSYAITGRSATLTSTGDDPDPDPPGGGADLVKADLRYVGMFKVPVDDPGGAKTRWGYSVGNITTRRVDGVLRVIISGATGEAGGDYNSTEGDSAYEVTYPGAHPTFASAPRATLIRNWGAIYGSRRITGNPSNGPVTRSFHWDPVYNGLRWAYGNGYNVAGYHDPSLGFTRFNDDAGSFTVFGPFRTEEHSQRTRGFQTRITQAMADAYTGGRRWCVGAPPTSGNAASPVGLMLFAVQDYDPTTRTPDVVVLSASVPGGLECLPLAKYDPTHPQPRTARGYKACAWDDPGFHSTTVGSTAVGATSIAVADTTLYAQPGSDFGGYFVCTIGAQSISYTGRSTSSGAGNLTGVPASGAGSVTGTIAHGTSVVLSTYDSGRGGLTADGEASFNNNNLRMDLWNGAAYCVGTVGEGLVVGGQMTDIIPGHVYPTDGMPHNWYGPQTGGFGTCPHGHVAHSGGTGPMADTLRPMLSIYAKANLGAAATGAIQPYALTPTVDLTNPQTLDGVDGASAADLGAAINSSGYFMGNMAYDPVDRLLFWVENYRETIGEPRSVVHVIQVG